MILCAHRGQVSRELHGKGGDANLAIEPRRGRERILEAAAMDVMDVRDMSDFRVIAGRGAFSEH